MGKLTYICIWLCVVLVWPPLKAQVPRRITCVGLKLRITSHARREIASKMQALLKGKQGLAIKVARAQQYFPLIEEALRAENVPVAVKYLAVQESGLIADAVSSSQAVGFWQFKDFTAKEVGLRIDRSVDARMHIIAATRGAARYLKTNNFYFDNWIYAITAYYAGRGGAEDFVLDKYMGKSSMTISKHTHWYVKTFLAHLLVFEQELAKSTPTSNAVQLVPYTKGAGKSLRHIANTFNIRVEELKKYNKWLRKGRVPKDETLPVIVPLQGKTALRYIAKYDKKRSKQKPATTHMSTTATQAPSLLTATQISPQLLYWIDINGIPALVAHKNDDISTLVQKGDITEELLRWYNDIQDGHQVKQGQIYYLGAKRARAFVHYHIAKKEETCWDIAQQHGIRLSSLLHKNRMKTAGELQTGRLLWLRTKRPKHIDVVHKKLTHHTRSKVPSSSIAENIPQQVHIVQAGESLYTIAHRYGISISTLLAENGLSVHTLLHPGNKLKFTVKEHMQNLKEATENWHTHIVQAGETLQDIARQYNLSIATLKKWNKKTTDTLKVGEKLKWSQ